jgi:amicyanin
MTLTGKTGLWARRGLLCLALAGLSTGVWAEGDKVAVKIDNFAFLPGTLTVKKGTEVTWTNHDDIPHTVLAIGTKIRSKTLDTDQSYSFTFDQAGTFNYICALHPHMKGKVVVTE